MSTEHIKPKSKKKLITMDIFKEEDESEEIEGGEKNNEKNCFICKKQLDCGRKYNLILCKVNHSESKVTELLGRLVEDDWVVFVSEDDFICHRCLVLLNQMDELELNLQNVKNKLTQTLKHNYNLASSDLHSAEDEMNFNDILTQYNDLSANNCGISTVRKNIANENKKEKSKDRKNMYKCDICGIFIKDYITFVRHIKHKHGLSEDYLQKFKASKNIIKPDSLGHTVNKIYTLKNKSKHNVKKSVDFNFVQRNTVYKNKSKSVLNIPTNTVNSENDLTFCDVCGISVFKKEFEVHASAHANVNYTCWACDECFYDELSCKIHQENCKSLLIDDDNTKININSKINNDCLQEIDLKHIVTIKAEEIEQERNTSEIKENFELEKIIVDENLIESDIAVASSSENCLNKEGDSLDNKMSLTNLKHSLQEYENNNKKSSEIVENLLDIVEPIISQIYKCGICGFKDPSILVVKDHVDNHNDIVQRSFKCEDCHLSFATKTILSLHVVRRHKNINAGHCLFCKKMFLDKTHLNVHIEKDHSDVKTSPFCAYCGKMHTTEGDLKTHILRHHFNDLNVQFSGEMAVKDNMENKLVTSDADNQSLVNTPSSSNVFDKVFSENLEEDVEQHIIYKSSFHIQSEQETIENQEQNVCCAMCNFTTKEETEMIKHITCHQTKENNFCKICCQFFCSKDYVRHLSHGIEFQSLPCKYCSDLFHDAVHLKCHVKKMHHEVDLHSCKYCSKVYTEKNALLKHTKTKHMPDKVDKLCSFCKMTFKNDRYYNNHIEYAHRTSLNCKFCGKEIQNWKKLQYHEKAHLKHSKTNYSCDICNKVLKTQTGLRFHKIRHNGNFPFFCEFCGQGFVSTHSLTEHIGHHTKETRYTCDVCGKGFYYYDTMYRHRILHDNPYPKTCDICKKHFRNASRVAIHKRREHTGEKPYKCTYCPQTFFTSNGYKHHLCLHTKIFPYNCKPCNKGFTTRHKYAIHLSRKHNDHTLLINRAPNNKEWNEQWLK